jgi:glucose-1-phosphate adenylyltransferase
MAKRPARATSGRYVSRLTSGTLAVIMAGGRGERLKGLTENRAKPATPFGGKFRIIDFVLSNCVNSGIRQITVLTQYKAQSLIQHIHRGWGYMRGEFGEFVEVIPAQQKTGSHWYRGTADAVYQNIDVMHAHRPKHVLVLAGDHIYKMDYGPMIAYHVEKGADITVGVVEVPIADAREFGVLTVTEWNRVTRFVEKSPTPDHMPGRPDVALASMGIYVFNPDLLERLLIEDAANDKSKHDFGKNIVPDAIEKLQVFAYPFRDVKTRAQSYWRDVGTIDAFYEANIEMVWVNPELNIYDEVSGGVIISGATVRESLLFSGVRVEERSNVERSVILPNVRIGPECQIRNSIIDENCEIAGGTRIGFDRTEDSKRFLVTEKGVVLVTPEMLAHGHA